MITGRPRCKEAQELKEITFDVKFKDDGKRDRGKERKV